MRELSVEEIKAIELDILRYVDNICKENNILYFLSGGTLIGAVRHKGFIPWDDDIDIIMPRPDYEKLIDILKDDKRYCALACNTREDYYNLFAKIVDKKTYLNETNVAVQLDEMGVYIDVFPLDGVPSDEKKRKLFLKKMAKLRNFYFMSLYRIMLKPAADKRFKFILYPIYYISWKIARIIGWERLLKAIDRRAREYPYGNCEYVSCLVGGYGVKELFTAKAFEKQIYMDFEREKFPVPIGYDEYLTKLFGDYMQLPPKDQQVLHHHFNAYWRDKD